VFERFPRLKVVLTEGSAAALPKTIADLDQVIRNVQKGAIGELKYRAEDAVPKLASEYFAQNCWIGSSFPKPSDVEVAKMVGPDRWMWGSDYPHDEGTPPFTTELVAANAAATSARTDTTPEEVMARQLERHGVDAGRFGEPSEVAAAVVFLASEAASWITGATLEVDGGTLRSV